ncbi:DUF192 domain-containing protein [Caulobacter sp. BP25]|uniref:DUF192 domain-containing protein n=1 Tax=Caulobacter sp. BP25 TaxID=2048900 RepID=UPI003512A4E0
MIDRRALLAMTCGAWALGLDTASAVEARLEMVEVVTSRGRARFQVEIAATQAEQARGLMFRKSLAPDRGITGGPIYTLIPLAQTGAFCRSCATRAPTTKRRYRPAAWFWACLRSRAEGPHSWGFCRAIGFCTGSSRRDDAHVR